MYAFYCTRGYSLEYLANLGTLEKRFLYCAMVQYYEDKKTGR